MAPKKRDTSRGFRPRVPRDAEVTKSTIRSIRADGRLDEAVLPRGVHRSLLAAVRLRNVASSLLIEGVPIEIAAAERALDTGKARDSAERCVLSMGAVYADVSAGRLPHLTIDGIRGIHRRLFDGVFSRREFPQHYIGRLKPVENVVAFMGVPVYYPTPPDRVEAELESLLAWIEENRDVHSPPLLAAIAHAEFEGIHPFADGNGRVGRILNHVIMRSCGMENITAVPLDERFYLRRDDYYDRLSSTEKRADYGPWCRFFVGEVEAAYKSAESSGFGDVLERLPRGATREVYRWVLQGERGTFAVSDFPNPRHRSPSGLRAALRDLCAKGILQPIGEAKGRRYRLRREFLEGRFRGDRRDRGE